jgi:hypothetical protein
MGMNLYDTAVKATAKFALPSKPDIRKDIRIPCPFCLKPDIAIGASGGLEMHTYRGGYHICEASGKSPEKARLLQVDKHFNLINDDDKP